MIAHPDVKDDFQDREGYSTLTISLADYTRLQIDFPDIKDAEQKLEEIANGSEYLTVVGPSTKFIVNRRYIVSARVDEIPAKRMRYQHPTKLRITTRSFDTGVI